MSLHRFAVGQSVEFAPGRLDATATRGAYTVVRLHADEARPDRTAGAHGPRPRHRGGRRTRPLGPARRGATRGQDHEAAAMLGGLGGTSYPTNPEGLTAPGDIAAAAEALVDAWERGEAATGETVARGMPLVMALVRSGSEGTR